MATESMDMFAILTAKCNFTEIGLDNLNTELPKFLAKRAGNGPFALLHYLLD